MSKWFQAETFKRLETEWYEKLREDGFDDIEDTRGPERFLKTWHSLDFYEKARSAQTPADRADYFRRASHFYHDHAFRTADEKNVWFLHSEGLSVRKIAKELGIKTCRVQIIISKLRKEMLKGLA